MPWPVRPGPGARLFPREGLRRLLVPHPPPPFSGARRTQPMGAAPRVVAARDACSLVPPRDRIPSPPPTATICGTASAATTSLPRRQLSPSSTADPPLPPPIWPASGATEVSGFVDGGALSRPPTTP
uniref:Uncharacterized protein n=1 Tax=Triticum urartu TaxID=4572 RepID=A0A8R7VEY4_TRIUA